MIQTLSFSHTNRNLIGAVFCLVLPLILSGSALSDDESKDLSIKDNSAVTIKNDSAIRERMNADPENARSIAGQSGADWCQTQIRYDQKYQRLLDGQAACPQQGVCDITSVRNANIPDSSVSKLFIRLKFNVFTLDDGSAAAASLDDVEKQVEQLNNDFYPSRIEFEYEVEFINSTAYRFFADAEEFAMKSTYADRPDQMLNVYVVDIQAPYIGVGTFPWDPDALNFMGGTIIDDSWFGDGNKTLTHEIGHCVGLWHTHHGVSEVATCGVCYEAVGAPDRDQTGDLCSDTDPTPTNFNCSPPGGTDDCSGLAWGSTDPQNYMGYAPDFCYSEFSSQQWGRMHCWIQDILPGWITGVRFSVDTSFGQAPLDVQFTGITNKTVNQWLWDLGDGDSAFVQSPIHQYDSPGVYSVGVQIETTDGPYESNRANLIAAYADTVNGDSVAVNPSVDNIARFNIYARNYLPLQKLLIPFSWGGPLNLQLDSASAAGLRSDAIPTQGFVHFDPFTKRATYELFATADPATHLDTGSGPVLSLFFTVPSGATSGSNPISLATYSSLYPSIFVSTYGIYSPEINDGEVSICIFAGDADGSAEITISDAIFIVTYIFAEGIAPSPLNLADATCDGSVDISDAIFLVKFIFSEGASPCDCAP